MKLNTSIFASLAILASIVISAPTLAAPKAKKPKAAAASTAIKFEVNSPQKLIAITANKMAFYTTLKGPVTQTLKLSIIAPKGTKATVKEAYAASASKVKTLNRSTKNFFALTDVETGKESVLVGGRSIAGATPVPASGQVAKSSLGTMDCSQYTLNEVNMMIVNYKENYNITTTMSGLCGNTLPKDFSGGGTGGTGGTSGGGTTGGGNTNTSSNVADQYITVIVKKDACIKSSAGKYIVRVELDFTKARLSALTTNEKQVNIVALTEKSFDGDTATSIKPVSDGMYAPDPLLLMSSVGYTFGGAMPTVELFSLKGKKIQKIGKMTADPRLIPYRGHSLLSFHTIKKYLGSGQMVTAQITDNRYKAYGVCIKLLRTRQYYNGY